MDFKELKKIADQNKFIIDDRAEEKFKKFYELLVEYNLKFNLTSITEESEVYEKHFLDSISPAFTLDLSDKKILDIGTGAGFPGIVLKIVLPNARLVLIDSNYKKISFLNKVIEELDLSYIETVCIRAEDYAKGNREQFDIVISRAVTSLPAFMELAVAALKVKGYLISMKGLKYQLEIDSAISAASVLSCEFIKEKPYHLPDCGAYRHNLVYQKMKATELKYPRSYSVISSKPL